MSRGKYIRTVKTRIKNGLSFKGKKHTAETKLKISLALSGGKNPNWGNFGKSSWNKGISPSEETRKKLSKGSMGNKNAVGTIRSLAFREQRRLAIRGNKNPFWMGGISDSFKNRLSDRGWNKIRRECYKRDNWTCRKCGAKDKLLHAHHIIPYRISKDDSLSNLITVCQYCHYNEERRFHQTALRCK